MYKHILDNLPNLKFNNKNIHKVIIEIKDNDMIMILLIILVYILS